MAIKVLFQSPYGTVWLPKGPICEIFASVEVKKALFLGPLFD